MATPRQHSRALTLKVPWASLVIAGIKDVECRTWRTTHRGLLLIHAGNGVDRRAMEQYGHLVDSHPRGVILGTVELVDVVRDHRSPWAIDGCWHWVLADARPFDEPVPCSGRLGLWRPSVGLLEPRQSLGDSSSASELSEASAASLVDA